MKKNIRTYLASILAPLLMVAILFSSFGFSLYMHKCKTQGTLNFSLVSFENCSNKDLAPSCCTKKINTDKISISNSESYPNITKIKKDCCSLGESSYKLSPVYLLDKLLKIIHTQEYYNSLSKTTIINNTKYKLEFYFKDIKSKIVLQSKSIIQFIVLITTLPASDSENTSS